MVSSGHYRAAPHRICESSPLDGRHEVFSSNIATRGSAYSMPTPEYSRRQSTRRHQAPLPLTAVGGARGDILSELCGRRLTALELAERFSITSSAIRGHLTELRKSGLVRYRTEVRGVGKPTHVYELTREGQYLLSSAYVPALAALLRAANARLGDRVNDLLRDAGRALVEANRPAAERRPAQRRSLRASAEECAALLRSLGGSAEVETSGPDVLVRSECCPLSAVVADTPIACKLFEGVARALTGKLVEEHCDRAEQPHCLFLVPKRSS